MKRLRSFGLSDIGLGRPNNEDVWIALPKMGFFAIADGMGGHKAGEVAAYEAITHLAASMEKISTEDPLKLLIELREAIERANYWVYSLSQKEESFRGMGTTLCCLIWSEQAVVYGHVGDSRVYRMREQQLELLTQDHSLYAKWKKFGRRADTPYPYKNVITKAIGTSLHSSPEIAISTYLPGDLFFLCTDGLTDVLFLKDIEKILNASNSLEEGASELILAAKNKGSSDNITVLMIQNAASIEENLLRQQRYNPLGPSSEGSYAPRSDGSASEPF